MTVYPLGLRIAGKLAIVVGGGVVGTRRALALVEAGALVRVISPMVSQPLARLAAAGKIEWVARGFQPGDTEAAWLVHTATGVADVDSAVAAEADAARIFCVNATDSEASSAWVPAVTRGEGHTVAAFGNGVPKRAMQLRDQISDLLASSPIAPGTVVLVGGGPGPIDLLTVRGRNALAQADVVVYDRLGPGVHIEALAPTAQLLFVGKEAGNHIVPQEQINQILVEHAKAGKRVVRLKGGDSFVFGRGGEELEFCAKNDVATQVVPGVTSAISVPAVAGIPVTHRAVAQSFTVITGHEALEPVAGGRDNTLVILMGVTALAESAANLAAGERGAACPVAIIEDGYGPNQRVSFGTLDTIAEVAKQKGVKAPAVIVVGDVVLQSEFAPAGLVGRIELGN